MDNLPGDILRLLIRYYIFPLDLPNFVAVNKRTWLLRKDDKFWLKLYTQYHFPVNHTCLKGPQYTWYQRLSFVVMNFEKSLNQLINYYGNTDDIRQYLAEKMIEYIYNLCTARKLVNVEDPFLVKYITGQNIEDAHPDVYNILTDFLVSIGYEFVDRETNYGLSYLGSSSDTDSDEEFDEAFDDYDGD